MNAQGKTLFPAPDGDFDTLPKRLNFLKRRSGAKNASDFARMAGVSRSSMSLYLMGRQAPRPDVLHRLAKATGVHIDWLLGTPAIVGASAPASSPGGSPASGHHILSPEMLDAPVNFYLLAVSLRTCKEFFDREARPKPSLRDVLAWISGPYSLHATIPDSDFRLLPGDQIP